MSLKPRRSWGAPDPAVAVGPAVAAFGVWLAMTGDGGGRLPVIGTALAVAGSCLWASNGFGWLGRRMFLSGWVEEYGGTIRRGMAYRLSGQDLTYGWFGCAAAIVLASAAFGPVAFIAVLVASVAANWGYASSKVKQPRLFVEWEGSDAALKALVGRAVADVPRYSAILSYEVSQEAYALDLVLPNGGGGTVAEVEATLRRHGLRVVEPGLSEWNQW